MIYYIQLVIIITVFMILLYGVTQVSGEKIITSAPPPVVEIVASTPGTGDHVVLHRQIMIPQFIFLTNPHPIMLSRSAR